MMTINDAANLIANAITNNTAVSLDVAKSDPKAEVVFLSPTGAYGVCTGELSSHKKPTAYMTCTKEVDGKKCDQLHLRERSDWHQCGRCPAHAKKKSKSSTSSKSIVSSDPEVARLAGELKEAQKLIKAKERDEKKEERVLDLKSKRLEDLRAKLAKVREVAMAKGVAVSTQTIIDAQTEVDEIDELEAV